MGKFSDTIPNEMFDFPGYYDKIAEAMPNDCRIAEVGNADGASAIYLGEKLQELGKSFTLHMIDDCSYGGYEQRNTLIRNIVGSGLGGKLMFMELDSLNASLKFPDGYFHFIFLDSGHTLDLTRSEIRLWVHKLLDDWYLAGHDYKTHAGVKSAVDEIIPANRIVSIDTDKGYGIWQYKKDWQITLK